MSELTLTVLQLGFVVLLWVFVLSVVGVLRRDLFGAKVVSRDRAARRPPAPSPARPAPARATAPVAAPARATTDGGQDPRALVVTEGSLRGTSLTLGSAPVLIGRNPECTLVLTDDYASGRHARLFPSNGRWYVEDLESTNGTQLGRARVTEATPVEVGQQLRIGRTVLELRR